MDKRHSNSPKKQSAKEKKADHNKSAEHKIVAGAFKTKSLKKS